MGNTTVIAPGDAAAPTRHPRDPELDESRASYEFERRSWLAPAIVALSLLGAFGISLAFGYWGPREPLAIDTSTFIITAGLFVGALAMERLTELVIAPWVGGITGKASRTVVIGSVAALLAALVAGSLGLYLLEILTNGFIHTSPSGTPPANAVDEPLVRSLDIFVTAMAIAGGTKPLHDLLTSLEKRTASAKDKVSDEATDEDETGNGAPYRLAVKLTETTSTALQGNERKETETALRKDITRIVPDSELVDLPPATPDRSRPPFTIGVNGRLPFRAGTPSYVRRVYELAYRLAAAGYEVEPDLAAPSSMVIGNEATDTLPGAEKPRWALDQMNLSEASITEAEGGEGVLVGHPDTGYRPHRAQPDWDHDKDYDFLDDDDDPFDTFVDKPDLLEPDVSPAPGHGTSTSSVIGSQLVPRVEMFGVAPKATVVPYRVMRGPVHVFDSDVARAIDKAVAAGCEVISMSLGGFGFSGLHDAIKRAFDEGVIVVAAAGNAVGVVVSPADYPETIAAASSKANGRPYVEGSSQGPEVTITAPGTDVWRAGFDDDGNEHITPSTGTSYAAAHVAGLAALWRAKHRDVLASDQFKVKSNIPRTFAHLLRSTAQKWEDAGIEADGFGPGIVDGDAVLNAEFTGAAAPSEDDLAQALPDRDPESPIVKISAIGANIILGEGTNDIRVKVVNWLVGVFGRDAKAGSELGEQSPAKQDENIRALVESEAGLHYRTDPSFRASLDDDDAETTVPAAATPEFTALVGAVNNDGISATGPKSKALRRALSGKASVRGKFRWIGLALVVVSLLFAFAFGYNWDLDLGQDQPILLVASAAGMITAFYIGAQAIERLVEYTIGRVVFKGKPDRVTERAMILLGVSILLGCLLAGLTGFRLLEALAGDGAAAVAGGNGDSEAAIKWTRAMSIFVTGLAIGGGTAPLHNLITRIRVVSKAS